MSGFTLSLRILPYPFYFSQYPGEMIGIHQDNSILIFPGLVRLRNQFLKMIQDFLLILQAQGWPGMPNITLCCPLIQISWPSLHIIPTYRGVFRPDPLYEAIFTCTGNPVRSIGTQAHVDEEELGQTFNAMNSFWFILAALLGQGVDILPR